MSLTQSQLESVFSNTALAEDPNLAPSFLQGQDMYFTQKSTCQVASTVSQETNQFNNNIFPASSSNAFLAQHASSLGIPNVAGAQPSQGTIILAPPSGSPTNPTANFSIQIGSILTNPISAVQYMVTATTNFTTGATFISVPVPIQSVLSGTNTYCVPGTSLTFAVPLVIGSTTISLATVNNDIVSGIDTPTNIDLSALVAAYMQNPRGGGSTGDYFKWALESSSLITFAQILPSGSVSDQNIIFVSGFVGSGDPNFNINLSFPISRSANLATVNTMGTYIESIRPVNDNPIYATVSTYSITQNDSINPTNPNPSIILTVLLATGLSLSTIIVGSNGLSMTVEEWIQYQTRYAILSAPYTGTILGDGQPYILGEDIVTLIKSGLSSSTILQGYLCSLLASVTFSYSDNTYTNIVDIPVPNANNYLIPAQGGLPASLEIIYDLDVSIISIVTV